MNVRLKAAELTPLLRRLRPALYIGHDDLSQVMHSIDASIPTLIGHCATLSLSPL
jgi:hypothetical protein